MSRGVETAELIEPWIYSTLAGDSALADLVGDHIYGPIVPDEIDVPYVTFQLISLLDVNTAAGGYRIMVDALYQVKVVAETTSQDDIAPIAARVDTLLNVRNADTGTGFVTCIREGIISTAEVVDGQPFLHLGGRYGVQAATTT